MSNGKGLALIALGGLALAALAMHDSPASASTLPASWRPPADAKVEFLTTPIAGVPQLKRTSWHVSTDSSGQQAGTYILTQNAANLNDWIVAFKSDAGGGGVLAYSQTPIGGLLAQAAAAGL